MTKKRVFKNCGIPPIYPLNVAFVRNEPHSTSTAGWRSLIFPCGMPACVTPRGTPHSPQGSLVLRCIHVFFWHFGIFFSILAFFSLPAAGLSRALGSVARRELARTPRRKFGPCPRSVARALGVQSSKSPRGVIPST